MADTCTNNEELILSMGSLKECTPLKGPKHQEDSLSMDAMEEDHGKGDRKSSMEVSPPRKLDRYVSGSWIVYDANTQSLDDWLAETKPSEVMKEEKGVECIAVHNPGEELPVHSFQKEEYTKYLDLVTETMKKSKPTVQYNELHPLDYARKCCVKGIMSVAQKQRYTTGYWHLYETVAKVDEVWARVARATHERRLGIFSKVFLSDGQAKGLSMHIYAKDFTNECEVRKVLQAILDMGLVVRYTMDVAAYFKPDVYHSLGITCRNPWKLKSALYKEMLHELTDMKDFVKNDKKKHPKEEGKKKKENINIQVIQENHNGAVFGGNDIRIRKDHVKETPAGMIKQNGGWKNNPLKHSSGHQHDNTNKDNHVAFNKNKLDNSFSIGCFLSDGKKNKHHRRSLDCNTSKPDRSLECANSRLNRSFEGSSACGSRSPTVLFCYPIGQTGKDVIHSLFSKHGKVVDLQVKHNRGFAFIHMEDAYQAFQASMALNGFSLNGQTLQVSVKDSK